MKVSSLAYVCSGTLFLLLLTLPVSAQEAEAPVLKTNAPENPPAEAPGEEAPEGEAPDAEIPQEEASGEETPGDEALGDEPSEEPPAAEPRGELPPEEVPPVVEPPPVLTGPAVVVAPPPKKERIVTPQQYDDEYDDSLGLSQSLLAKPDPKFQISLGLDMSLPVADAANFAAGFSFQGFSIDVRYLGFDELQIGGMIAWHTMSNKLTDTIEEGPATLTGTMVRELSVTPMVAKVTYARLNKDGAIPYLSFGAGGARVLRRVDIGIARIIDENWQWAMIPEVGVMLPVGPVILMGALRYNLLIAGSGQPTTQYLNFVLALGLK